MTYLSVLEVTLSVLCNSLPMLLPLYSYWRYRKVFARDQDEYVSRIRDGGQLSPSPHKYIIQSVANGMPLETIVGCLFSLPSIISHPQRKASSSSETYSLYFSPMPIPEQTERFAHSFKIVDHTNEIHSTARIMYITQQKSAQATPVQKLISSRRRPYQNQ